MKFFLEKGKYAILLAIISSFIASIAILIWATIRMFLDVYKLFKAEESELLIAHFVSGLDSFIFAIIIYVFSIALYELFIGKLDLPEWLIIKNLDDLKKKLSSVIILMLAVIFLEHIIKWESPKDVLMFAIAIGVVIISLIFYMKLKEKP